MEDILHLSLHQLVVLVKHLSAKSEEEAEQEPHPCVVHGEEGTPGVQGCTLRIGLILKGERV